MNRGIDRMVSILETAVERQHGVKDGYALLVRVVLNNVLEQARRIASEDEKPDLPCYHGVCVNEKKFEKPTAPASLVDFVLDVANTALFTTRNPDELRAALQKIQREMMCYRPQTDIVGELHHACDHLSVNNEYGVSCLTVDTIKEIVSKYQGESK